MITSTTSFKKLANELGIDKISEAIEQEIGDKLNRAAKLDEIETTTFGLETDDGRVVKVFVNEKDAEKFEKLMADCLGKTDSIEDAINKAAVEVDIVDVEWPEDEDDEDEDEDVIDGSEALDPNVYGDKEKDNKHELKAKKEAGADETVTEAKSGDGNIANRFSTSNQHLVFQAILDLGIPEEALNRSVYRSSIIRGIKETAIMMQTAPGIKTALKMFVKKRVDFEHKKDTGKENVNESVLMENATADLYWSVIDQLLKAVDTSTDKHVATNFLELPKIAQMRNRSTMALQGKVTPQIKAKLNALHVALDTGAPKPAVQESLNGTDLAEGFKKLLKFAEPKGMELVDSIFSTTQGRLVTTAFQRKSNLLQSSIKIRLEQLLDLLKTPVAEAYNAHELGAHTFAEDEAIKILKALDNKVTTTVVATDGTKLVLSPRRVGSFLKVVGSSDKAEVTAEQVEKARTALA